MTTDDATRPDGLRLALGRPALPAPTNPAPWSDSAAWHIPDVALEDPGEPVRPLAALVSFHYLRAAVRRRRFFCIVLAVVGMLLGSAFLLLAPVHTASATLVLGHDDRFDPARAMATDVSLVQTRTVAEHAITALGLKVAPEKLAGSVSVVPTTSDLLELTMSAPSDAEAVRRLSAFVMAYLEFRATQVSAQSAVLVRGYQQRVTDVQGRITELNARITTLSTGGDTATERLSDAVTKRAELNNQIGSLQESIQDEALRQTAIVSASRVIDPPSAVPNQGRQRWVLGLASGLVGGGGFGLVTVVLQVILTDRLRLRTEVAASLEAPVAVSVGPLSPPPGWQRPFAALPWRKARRARRVADMQRFAAAVQRLVPESGRRQRLAIACIDNSAQVRFGVAAAAVLLQKGGRTVHLVDLTESGGLEVAVVEIAPGSVADRPEVFRPLVVPSLTTGPADFDAAAPGGDLQLSLGRADISLVLADLDPRIGADHLRDWTDRVVVAVTAGRTGVERIRTTGDLLRAAELDLCAALLVEADPDDESSGNYWSKGGVPGGTTSVSAPAAAAHDMVPGESTG